MSLDLRLVRLRIELFTAAQMLTGEDAKEFWRLLDEVQSVRPKEFWRLLDEVQSVRPLYNPLRPIPEAGKERGDE